VRLILVLRDINERGREIASVLVSYNKFVKHAYDTHIKPVIY
jgi:uridine kinase